MSAPGPAPSVRYEVDSHRCTITLDRPEVHNALDRRLRQSLAEAVVRFEEDDRLRVAILTGAGGRAFSAGDDLREMADELDDGPDGPREAGAGGERAPAFEVGRLGAVPGFDQVRTCTKPILAAIDGYCLAGGFELALYCDVRLATRQSTFGLPEPRRGLLPGPGLHELPKFVPLGEALQLQLSGGRLSAARAYEIGLVQSLADDRAGLFEQATALAEEIAACAPLAVQAVKHVVRSTHGMPAEEAWAVTEAAAQRLSRTEDAAEGIRAFAEHRPPRWQGR